MALIMAMPSVPRFDAPDDTTAGIPLNGRSGPGTLHPQLRINFLSVAACRQTVNRPNEIVSSPNSNCHCIPRAPFVLRAQRTGLETLLRETGDGVTRLN
jgi:hypothetical protein